MHRLPAADPVTLLEPFQSTLEVLDLAMVQCEDDAGNYPRVHRQRLAHCYYGTTRGGISIALVICAFPNVVDFSLSAAEVRPMVSHWEEGRCCDHADVIDRCRSLNMQWQHEHEGWLPLQSVSVGHVVDLYMLGLRRPVPHVEIQAFSEGTIWMFRHVLSDTRPSHLTLSLFARDHILDCIPRLIPAEDPATYLAQLSVIIRCDAPEIDVERIIVGCYSLFHIHCYSLYFEDESDRSSHETECWTLVAPDAQMGYTGPLQAAAGWAA